MNWLHYLLEANIYLAVFYLLYFVLLNNETHYKLNRAYLLITCIVAYIIPIIQVGVLRPATQYDQTITILLNKKFKPAIAAEAYHFSLQNFILYTYIVGALVMFGIFAIKVIQLVKLTRTRKSILNDKYQVVMLQDSNTAFSFFNYVFIGSKVAGSETIIRHELVHVDQRHSFDIVFLELIKIVNWFNPFIYLFERGLKTVHEYIADEQTAAFENGTLAYSSFLVNNAYGISGSSITHSFFNYNLLKKRIIMLNQKRSGNLARLKYLLAVPLCGGLLCISTLGFSKTYGWIDLSPQKTKDTLKLQKTPAITNVNFKTGVSTQEIRYKANNKDYYKVIVIDKSGKKATYYSDNISEANRKMLWEKYNFHFSSDTVESITLLPPPPPTPPKSKNPNSKVKPTEITIDEPEKTVSADVKNEIAAARAKTEKAQQKLLPPPMAPFLPPSKEFGEMTKYIAKNVRYSAAARRNNLVGSVIVKFEISENHKVSNAALIKGIGSGCSEEALRVIKSYTGEVNVKPGTYKLAVTYNLDGVEAPKPASESLANDPSFVGEVVIMGYPSK